MITQKSLANFYHEFGVLINAGVNINQALQSLLNSISGFELKRIIGGIKTEIERGKTLAEAMAAYPRLFSALQLRIVDIGERSGKLSESLQSIADNLERNHRIRTKFITGFIYPVLLLHAAIFIPAIHVLILEGLLPYLKIVAGRIIVLYGVGLIVVLVVKITNRIYGLKSFFQYTFNYVPIVGPLIKRLAIARFMWNLSALYSAGENVVTSVKIAAESCDNIPLSNSIFKILPEIKQGGSLTSALRRVRFFPSMVSEMLSAGEESGRIGNMLDKIAEYYEKESETIVKRLVIILPLFVYLLVMLYIAYIVLSFYVGYLSQINSLFEGF
jgi:type IV pilus assembly protein PilC